MADGSQSRKLRFEVAFVSGQDPEYPASELNVHSPETRGWASPQFSEFPVELGLKFLRAPVRMQQLQILSHQSKIATRIELFVGRGSDYFSADWRRLGYLSLDSNERSGFKARELKSVYVDAKGHFLKMLVHKPHQNGRNLLNQVGIVAVNALGTALPHDAVPTSFKSSSSSSAAATMPGAGGGGGGGGGGGSGGGSGGGGSRRHRSGGGSGYGRAGGPPAPGPDDLAVDMGLDRETAALYRDLHAKKLAAVSREDFAAAQGVQGGGAW
ncbi:hypothetical protein FNF31_07287 [Cafeteria roenbergensis]|uniref:Centrosomal protein CEP104 N-terminal domain-containing protein n=1 Tax=Cafeteria roenbergensis TaxID=33653 RepID=A0A5A8C7I5_CAFRO|nr:hypothetical protein FNF31_07287 [Cafeteria roenbergensis]